MSRSLALILVLLVSTVRADDDALRFRVKLLAVDTNECCAVADIDRDGRLDVIAGRSWYAAPEFTPRPLRPIGEFGKDYSENNGDHAWDVNGDGWIDIVAGSFLPTEVAWFENPGAEGLNFGKQWKRHLLADTKASKNEMTWLRDLDGDGAPEFAVNSWDDKSAMLLWRLTSSDTSAPSLSKIVVGKRGNGHGMGFGDINGDGRDDIVFQGGWYEQPASGLAGEWRLRGDWRLAGASCPILVRDLDGDGRNDMVWGKGHDYGLFWMEQLDPGDDGATRWKQHEIDSSFSQAHALAWADLDGDGEDELITGKRVRAHSGGDPGAAEKPALYSYRWNPESRKFHRRTIVEGRVGTGLQIRTPDIDGDGDVDIVVAGKSGTFVLFNERL